MKEKQPPPEDERTDRPRTDKARQAAGDYANDLRAILKMLRKRVILKKLRKRLK